MVVWGLGRGSRIGLLRLGVLVDRFGACGEGASRIYRVGDSNINIEE